MAGFRLTSHTADVGLVAWGATLAEAFGAAVRALVSVTFDLDTVAPREEARFQVAGDDPDRLLVRLLNEVVYLIDSQGFVPSRATVRIDRDGLEATLLGQIADERRPARRGPQVKAVTYHGLEVVPGPPARVRAVLDI